jgi:hypothetical protein
MAILTRHEIDRKLHADRAWLLDQAAALDPSDLLRGATPSEHDPDLLWSPKDHFVHLALIEHNFVGMIRRFFEGDGNPVGLLKDKEGSERSREEIMAGVHAMTEQWAAKHRDKSWDECLAVTQLARAETLKLLGELSDEQLEQQMPGAPWADGVVGGILAVNALHGRQHWQWAMDGLAERRL